MDAKIYKQHLLKQLYSSFPHCSNFDVETNGATQVVYGEGNPNAPLMIIGEAPGKQEDELGRPFVGRSGRLLTRTLEQAGVKRSDVFITNVAKCRPPNNGTPTPQEVALYKQLVLIPEIHIIRPKVILTLGSVALEAVLEKGVKISQVRGTLQHKNDLIIIPTYHPAYILRNPNELQNFSNDIKFAISVVKKHPR